MKKISIIKKFSLKSTIHQINCSSFASYDSLLLNYCVFSLGFRELDYKAPLRPYYHWKHRVFWKILHFWLTGNHFQCVNINKCMIMVVWELLPDAAEIFSYYHSSLGIINSHWEITTFLSWWSSNFNQMAWERYCIIMEVQKKLQQRSRRQYQKDIELFQW